MQLSELKYDAKCMFNVKKRQGWTMRDCLEFMLAEYAATAYHSPLLNHRVY